MSFAATSSAQWAENPSKPKP